MSRLNLLLGLLVLVCALSVVTARHQARKSFVELQAAQKAARAIDIEWGRLQLEQSTWAMHARIERVATEQLRMHAPEARHIRVLRAPPAGDAS